MISDRCTCLAKRRIELHRRIVPLEMYSWQRAKTGAGWFVEELAGSSGRAVTSRTGSPGNRGETGQARGTKQGPQLLEGSHGL